MYSHSHSQSHVQLQNRFSLLLAVAISSLYDDVKLGQSGQLDQGFFFDFEMSTPLSPKDFDAIESKIKQLIKAKQPFENLFVSKSEALSRFEDQPYQLELLAEYIQKHPGEQVNLNQMGNLATLAGDVNLSSEVDLSNDVELNAKAFKLVSVSGAYWKGDASRPMLQRLYGTAWPTVEALKAHQAFVKDASERDHRVLAKQMDLFSFDPTVGLGLPLWHPNGAMIRFLMERFSQSAHILNGYQWVYSPHIGKAGLWETSGHLDFYKESMYSPIAIEDETYYLKPMSCPFHVAIYNARPRSYKELPVRLSEFAAVYRYELSGALQGLSRVRGFTQDDAHIICTPEQSKEEISKALKFSLYILRAFGFNDFTAYISTKPPLKSIGSDADWHQATEVLKASVVDEQLDFAIDEGGGAFYGPKIDLKLRDALGREWQCSTIQFDFNLPERFQMSYIGSDGHKATPLMVHRALFGSVERFFSLLVEHYKGAFPLWLAPVQIGIIPVSDEQLPYALKVREQLLKQGLRVVVAEESDSLKNKIKSFSQKKLPVLLVVGNNEAQNGTVSLRQNNASQEMPLVDLLNSIRPELDKGVPVYLG